MNCYRMPGNRGAIWAELRTEQHDDGRWMWGLSFTHDNGGYHYLPFSKWGKFAPTEQAALRAAAEELRGEIADEKGAAACRMRVWLRGLAQPSLFEGSEAD